MKYPVNYIGITKAFSYSHNGVDFGWNSKFYGKNQPVYAVDDGVVIYNRKQFTGGYVIHIKHDNGYVSEYGHLKKNSQLVHEKDKVKKGQQIALMGGSGIVTGNHLHFGLYKGSKINYKDKSKFVDPLKYLCMYDSQIVSSKSKSKIKFHTKHVKGADSEGLNVRNKENEIVGTYKNGTELETFEDKNSTLIYVDNIRKYTTYKKYLK